MLTIRIHVVVVVSWLNGTLLGTQFPMGINKSILILIVLYTETDDALCKS